MKQITAICFRDITKSCPYQFQEQAIRHRDSTRSELTRKEKPYLREL